MVYKKELDDPVDKVLNKLETADAINSDVIESNAFLLLFMLTAELLSTAPKSNKGKPLDGCTVGWLEG